MAYDYIDPYQQAQQPFPQMPSASQPFQQPVVPYSRDFTAPMPVVEAGPLASLQSQIAGVLNSADSHHVYLPGPQGSMLTYPRGRQHSVAGDMVKGALLGFGARALWRGMQRRKARVGEFTTPFARFLAIWWGFMAAGFMLSIIWPIEAVPIMFMAFALGTVLSLAYAVFRVTGHGRYNTRRRGGAHRSR